VPPADLSFDHATALRAAGDGVTFDTDVHANWTVGDKPNGGYLLALLGRAARAAGRVGPVGGDGDAAGDGDGDGDGDRAQEWEVVAATITYLRPPALGPAQIRTIVLRRGRSASHVRAVLVQGGDELVDAVFVVSALPDLAAPRYDDVGTLEAPAPEKCVRLPPQMPGGVRVGIMEVLDLRMDPATIPFTPPPASGEVPRAELRGWARFADGREPDALSLLFSVDAIPPPTSVVGSTGWVPTLQMSAYVRGHPAPGWLGIRITAHLIAAGMVDETCTVWDSSGRVVAQATQLARVRFADEMT
jgi:Thioesterase-like superfamily